MKTINGEIKNGKVTMEAEGFVGGSCMDATRAYLERLGDDTGSPDVVLKESYYQTEVSQAQ